MTFAERLKRSRKREEDKRQGETPSEGKQRDSEAHKGSKREIITRAIQALKELEEIIAKEES